MDMQGRIRLEALTTEQLRDMNQAICSIINGRNSMRAYESAQKFHVGQKAKFRTKQGANVEIIIERINVKSISGKERGGYTTWRVHPSLLSPVIPLVREIS